MRDESLRRNKYAHAMITLPLENFAPNLAKVGPNLIAASTDAAIDLVFRGDSKWKAGKIAGWRGDRH